MSLYRRAARRDGNEQAIVEVFTQMGATWQPISASGAPDGIVGVLGRMALVEVKVAKGKLRESQEKWHGWWRGPTVHVIRSVEDATKLVQKLRGGL